MALRKTMAKRKKKAAGLSRWFMLGVLLVGMGAAVAFYASDRFHFNVRPPAEKPTVTITPQAAIVAKQTVFIYLPKETKKGSYLARVETQTSERGDRLDAALKALLMAGEQGGVAAGLIPEGTKSLAPVHVKGDVATINLSREFTENFSGGSDQEALTVNSIVHTLVSNSSGQVSSVRILVEGESVETLGGHLEMTDPVKADSTLLRPGSLK